MKDNKFGELYIQEVRDRSIDHFERMVDGRMKGLTAQEIREKISSFSESERDVLLWLIPKVVDECMFNMLEMFEENEEDVFLLYEGENMVENSDGLSGELFGADGWIAKYSKKPFEE